MELKPCPFCGGEAECITDNAFTQDAESYVRCRRCRAQTSRFISDDLLYDMNGKPNAAKAWNRRANE